MTSKDSEDPETCFDDVVTARIIENASEEIYEHIKSKYYLFHEDIKNKPTVFYLDFIINTDGKAIQRSIKSTGRKSSEIHTKLSEIAMNLPEILPVRNEKGYKLLSFYKIVLSFFVSDNDQLELYVPEDTDDGETSNSVNYDKSFEPPRYPGCKKYASLELSRKCMSAKISEVISKKYKVNKAVKDFNKSGTFNTFIIFKINKKGKVEQVEAYGPHPNFEVEAKKAILKIKKVKPGTKDGDPVVVPYMLPIKFKVED